VSIVSFGGMMAFMSSLRLCDGRGTCCAVALHVLRCVF
jgi:hypothetical protein